MLDFHKPTMDDRDVIRPVLQASGYMGCEFTFGNLLMWTDFFRTTCTVFDNTFVSMSVGDNGFAAYCCPAGAKDLKKAIDEIIADSRQRNQQMSFYGVTESFRQALCEIYPDRFEFIERRGSFDYIYIVSDLSDLAGKKYHPKRNHVTAFKKNNEWHYEEISESNFHLCRAVNEEWKRLNLEKNPDAIANESGAVDIALDNYFELGFTGGILFADDAPVAFTFGEKINDNCFCTHVEKAFSDVRGSYAVINREFAANTISGYKYVNREEDMGAEGLRKAKLSYHPEILLKKYNAVLKD